MSSPSKNPVRAALAVTLVLASAGCGDDSHDDVAATVEAWGAALRERDATRVCELMEHDGTPARCAADVRNSSEYGWSVRLDVRSVKVSDDTARATVHVLDPTEPASSTLRERTVPFGLRRADGRWRVLVPGR